MKSVLTSPRCRTKDKGGYVEPAEYIRVASEGRAIWIRKSLYVNGAVVRVERTNIAVVCSEPKLTVLILTVAGAKLLVGSCHIPHQARGEEARKLVLDSLETQVVKYQNKCGVLLGVDANARVPESVGNATGDLTYGVPDEAGRVFANRVLQWNLQLPSTFRDVHYGESFTWRHAGGSYSRIDFLAVEGLADFNEVWTTVLHDLDNLNLAHNHWPLVCGKDQVDRDC